MDINCPERPIFSAITLVQEELGMHHISADIGCHLFAAMPPLRLGATAIGLVAWLEKAHCDPLR